MGKFQTFRFQSNDFDEISASLARWNQSYRQLSAGTFHGDIRYLHIDSIEIFELHWGQVIHYQGLTPPDTIGFGLPLNITGESRYLNRPILNGELLIQRCGSEGDLIGSRNFKIQVLTINEQRFFDKVDLISGLDSRLLLENINRILLNPDIAETLQRKFHTLLHQASDNTVMKNKLATVVAGQVDNLLEDIAGIIVSGSNEQPKLRLTRQRQLVQKAKDYIWNRPAIPPRIDDMCEEIGTSERSLRDAFKACTGLSAGAYLKAVRLNQVRSALKAGPPDTILVQDAAFNWGFFHMGQFASDYKSLFGEAPSQTLSKGRTLQHEVA